MMKARAVNFGRQAVGVVKDELVDLLDPRGSNENKVIALSGVLVINSVFQRVWDDSTYLGALGNYFTIATGTIVAAGALDQKFNAGRFTNGLYTLKNTAVGLLWRAPAPAVPAQEAQASSAPGLRKKSD